MTLYRNGIGIGENFCPTLPYNCPPRPWGPDPGPSVSIADRLGTGSAQPVGVSGLACWPREWKPDDGQTLGVGFGFHFNVGGLIKDVGKVASGAVKDVGKVATGAEKFAGKAASSAVRIAGESVTDPKKFLHDVGHIASDVVKIEKFVLEQTAGLVSLIPGIGTAISTAISAGLAILEGGGPLDIAIKIAYGAIPIPPGIKLFTDLVLGAVLDIVNAVIKGGDLVKVLERLIAEELAKALPDDVRAAGTNMLTALIPTVLQAVTGKSPSVKVGIGDKVDDFVTQMKSQYAALNLPANVKKSTDPIFDALVSMVHSMNVGPAILLAVRTGIASKLPAGVARDVGLHIFDTLAHLILGHLFKGKPTQAQVATALTPAQLTAVHRAAAL